jgi:Ca2+/Na+ antiporter
MFGREALQRIKIKEQWWSCVFDTVQVLLVWPVMFLSDAKWWQAGVSLVAFCVLYVFFLLRDEDWIQEEK